MKKKKVVIVDDERLARVELRNLLHQYNDIEVLGEAHNADAGIVLIEKLHPDLIFLDIQMPEKSGFDLLEELTLEPAVIFTTAFDEYAIKAFEFNSLDYLLKPIQSERLRKAIDRVILFDAPGEVETTMHTLPYNDHLYIRDGDFSYFVPLEKISLFTSFGNYAKVHFDSKVVLVHRSLNQIERRLAEQPFFRANRFTIFHLEHIHSIRQNRKGKISVTLVGGHEILFSERKSVQFREQWGI